MSIDGMVEGRRYRVRTKDGLILRGRLSSKSQVTDPDTGKAQWSLLLKEVTLAAEPAADGGDAFPLAKDVAAVAQLEEGALSWRPYRTGRPPEARPLDFGARPLNIALRCVVIGGVLVLLGLRAHEPRRRHQGHRLCAGAGRVSGTTVDGTPSRAYS